MSKKALALAAAILAKLEINPDEFNSLFTECPVNGAVGTLVAEGIRQRFGLAPDEEDWATRLYEREVLTEAEWRFIRDG